MNRKKLFTPPIALSEHITTDKDAVLWIPKPIYHPKSVHWNWGVLFSFMLYRGGGGGGSKRVKWSNASNFPFVLRGQNKWWGQVRKRFTTLGETRGDSECGVLDLLSSEIFSSITIYMLNQVMPLLSPVLHNGKGNFANIWPSRELQAYLQCVFYWKIHFIYHNIQKNPNIIQMLTHFSYELWYSVVSDSPFSRGRDILKRSRRATRC